MAHHHYNQNHYKFFRAVRELSANLPSVQVTVKGEINNLKDFKNNCSWTVDTFPDGRAVTQKGTDNASTKWTLIKAKMDSY